MRFGVFIPQGWRFDLVGVPDADQWRVMRDLAQHADGVDGWESLWVYDHFHTTPQPSEDATHEAWTLMSAFAASTERIRLGQMCTCMAYRNPAYLAKVAATIDHVSGGRLEMGIGGGWYEHEWRAYGYGFPGPKERLGRLREGVQIFQQGWTTGSSTLDGEYYQVDGALCRPLPLQRTSPRNNIPMWIAGGGEKVTLRIAAQYADYTNFDGTPEGFAHKSSLLQEHCVTLGRDFDEITRSANYNIFIGADQAEVDERLAWFKEHLTQSLGEKAAAEYSRRVSEQGLVGTPDQIIERLTAAEKLGMSYAITYFPEAAYDRSGQELFESQVLPALA
ncbi:LLM class F420-dependent oxidoreductase [Nocardioides sp. Kera G14]|uniref:LLM class F420-dependent oxidoreductase n=1 Tax=Nocardioides sp. Kera G14 TaxID=2884264 RepID=UPI001D10A2F2|nr:LLM class F420-dependent oxidoreductase [Nocardioides sp. Kera G14]UDY25330.1 LLM class F420-dependent oxidoreductase [Nocardioides sp. Kera G14]